MCPLFRGFAQCRLPLISIACLQGIGLYMVMCSIDISAVSWRSKFIWARVKVHLGHMILCIDFCLWPRVQKRVSEESILARMCAKVRWQFDVLMWCFALVMWSCDPLRCMHTRCLILLVWCSIVDFACPNIRNWFGFVKLYIVYGAADVEFHLVCSKKEQVFG
jgi:hypothetical protein